MSALSSKLSSGLSSKCSSLILKLLGLLPLRFVRLLARGLEILLRPFNTDLHRVTRINIGLVKPGMEPAQAEKLVTGSVRNALANAFEMALVWQRDNEWLNRKIVSISNEALVHELLRPDKGLLVIGPHVGNWEVIGRKLAEYGPTTSLYQPPRQEYMETLVRLGRERSGARLVPTNQRGIAALLRALRNGEIVGILPDQVPQKDAGVFVPFFGVPAYTMTLVHSLIKKTGCQVILAYALRNATGFDIVFKEADGEIYSEDLDTSVRALSRTVEKCTEEDFAQYQWEYKRYKRQPDQQYFY